MAIIHPLVGSAIGWLTNVNMLFYSDSNAILKNRFQNRIFAIEFDYRPQAYVVPLCHNFRVGFS
jgi:hypothetical protein